MATFSISEELVVTLKYYYEKKRSRNHIEMFFFLSFVRVFPRYFNLKLF